LNFYHKYRNKVLSDSIIAILFPATLIYITRPPAQLERRFSSFSDNKFKALTPVLMAIIGA
jgi:hypothetical protein